MAYVIFVIAVLIFLMMCLAPAGQDWLEKNDEEKNPCDDAPFPDCNGANGCDTCEHQKEEEK